MWKSSLHCSHMLSACPAEKRSKGIFSYASQRRNWDRAYHNSFSFCFWPKQWHFFLQVVASPFQLRSVSFSLGVGLSLSFIFSSPKLQMFSLNAWFCNHYVISFDGDVGWYIQKESLNLQKVLQKALMSVITLFISLVYTVCPFIQFTILW